jgi:predicted Zn-dependent protease
MGQTPTQFVTNLFNKAGARTVPITIERQGKTLSLTIIPELACRYDVKLLYSKVLNAFSDGEQIIIPSEMVNFTDDDELAFVLSHELAHNVLGHVERRMKNAATGMVFGAIFDIGLAAAGVNTQGLGMRTGGDIGRMAYSQEFEFEADYLSLYLMAQSGFDLSKSISFFRKLGVEQPEKIEGNLSGTRCQSRSS